MTSVREPASSLDIAQAAVLRPIEDVGADLGLDEDELERYGRYKAKVPLAAIEGRRDVAPGKLVAVTAITPTPAGEGKTTTAIGLADGLTQSGRRAVVCVREPSVGPVFGIKGGGAGGGRSQLAPMEDLNLHFTGDIHAVGAANNLLAAMIDAHVQHGNAIRLDGATVTWRRCCDVNDRALRSVITGLGGKTNGTPRETGFDITAASEVMAILAVARDLADLRERLGRITVGSSLEGEPVTAEALGAAGSMAVLLRDALKPNLIQTLEGSPALVHAGPFANIAHGNNSLVADTLALSVADYVVTEGGFGSDMGLEKHVDIVCRAGSLSPSAVVLVATIRALEHHGGGDLRRGAANLARHIEIVRGFGFDPVVAVNLFPDDSVHDVELVRALALEHGAFAAEATSAFSDGGNGAAALAEAVAAASERPSSLRYAYELDDPVAVKIDKIARKVYGARGVELAPQAVRTIDRFAAEGLDRLPVCMAKTHLSLSHDPALLNAPEGFTLPVRELRAYTGAGWLVALCGDMMTMPGLSAHPAALDIDIDIDGRTVGLR
ncbi:MAG TPA: formate--tetrahydrofolate ligase [Gaiellaceae bacterium]|nr:formate--tetrahydrofolate ligase [Gaiellaceae bacterium]